MATKKNTKGAKRRKPKGKRLSETLAEKDARKQELEQEAAEAEEAALAAQELDVDEADSSGDSEALESEAADDFGDDDGDSDDELVAERDEDSDDEYADDDEPLADDEEWEYIDEDGELVAAQMGHQRYVLFGFMAVWLIGAYVAGRAAEATWANIAAKDWFVQNTPFLVTIPPEGLMGRGSLSLVLGGLIAALIVGYYFRNADTRQWADEVADELSKVDWPTRKQIGNHTVVVIAASAVITAYLALLDRFWSFVTNLIYSAGA